MPDERIVWESSGEKGHVDGAVTFHELAPDLTRVLMTLEYHPQGFFEKTANLWRAQGRRARADMRQFRREMTMHTLLEQEEQEGWRGEIRDKEVVKSDEEGQEEEGQEEEGQEEDKKSESSNEDSSPKKSSSSRRGSSGNSRTRKSTAKKSSSSGQGSSGDSKARKSAAKKQWLKGQEVGGEEVEQQRVEGQEVGGEEVEQQRLQRQEVDVEEGGRCNEVDRQEDHEWTHRQEVH